MVSGGAEGGGGGQKEDPLRLLGYLKANKRVAYVMVVMVLVHLSNQYDRYLFSVSKIPFVDYDSLDFALIAGPFFTAFNSLAGVALSFSGGVRPVRLLSIACLVWSASTGAVAFTHKFWQVALARIGQGIGDAACSPFAVSILRDNFGPEVIGSAIGVYYVGLYAGFSLALGAGTLVDDLVGWKWSYLLAALAGAVVAALTFLTVPEPLPPGQAVLMPPAQQQRQQRGRGGADAPPGAAAVAEGSASTITRMSGGGGSRPAASSPVYSLVGREGRGRDSLSASARGGGYGSDRPAVGNGGSGSSSSSSSSSREREEKAGTEPPWLTAAVASKARSSPSSSPPPPPPVASPHSTDPRLLYIPPRTLRRPPPPGGAEEGLGLQRGSSPSSLLTASPPPPPPQPRRRSAYSRLFHRSRGKLSDLSAAWLDSPSLLLVCVAGGVRDAGGFVFGYYLASYFSPLLDGNPSLTQHGDDPCSSSYDVGYAGDQICDEAYPWCVEGSCFRLASSPWHDVGMPAHQLECFISWVPLVGGSLGAMIGGFLSDRVAQRLGTAGRLWVVIISNALASPFAVGVLLAPYPWCFVCLLGVELLGEMWIGVVLAVVIALVPRHVRITSVAMYNFIITNISGLSTTLVPLIRGRYNSEHTFSFLVEPLAGAAAAAAAAAAASSSLSARSGGGDGDSGRMLLSSPSGLAGAGAAEAVVAAPAEGPVEVSVSEAGSHGLQAALLWMYPGMYLASSFFCLAAVLALGRDKKDETAAAAAAAAAPTVAATPEEPEHVTRSLSAEGYERLPPAGKRWEDYGLPEMRSGSAAGGVGQGVH
ncbi:unnamed protein product, partial [Ectocarpus sp. 4 AP-2014]